MSLELLQQLSIFFSCCCLASCGSILLWLPTAYEQQWLTLAKEYHDHLKDMHSIPGMAGPDKWALKHGGSDKDDWKVQIFRQGLLSMMLQCVTVKSVALTDLIGMLRPGCIGVLRLAKFIPSPS